MSQLEIDKEDLRRANELALKLAARSVGDQGKDLTASHLLSISGIIQADLDAAERGEQADIGFSSADIRRLGSIILATSARSETHQLDGEALKALIESEATQAEQQEIRARQELARKSQHTSWIEYLSRLFTGSPKRPVTLALYNNPSLVTDSEPKIKDSDDPKHPLKWVGDGAIYKPTEGLVFSPMATYDKALVDFSRQVGVILCGRDSYSGLDMSMVGLIDNFSFGYQVIPELERLFLKFHSETVPESRYIGIFGGIYYKTRDYPTGYDNYRSIVNQLNDLTNRLTDSELDVILGPISERYDWSETNAFFINDERRLVVCRREQPRAFNVSFKAKDLMTKYKGWDKAIGRV